MGIRKAKGRAPRRDLARCTTLTAALAAVVIAGTSLACSGDDDTDDPRDGTTSATESGRDRGRASSTTDTQDAEREAVIEAYEASVDARIEASAPPEPNPDSEAIAATHTGPMLEQSQEVLRGLLANGWAIRYPEDSQRAVEVEHVTFESDDVALLDLCTVDDGERIVVGTGEVLASGVGTVEATAAMRRVDGAWRLAERQETNRWEGVDGCAAGW